MSSCLTLSDWLPDETLFSLVSRQHSVSGNVCASTTCHEVFGVDRLGPDANIPRVLASFVAATGGRYGTAVEILLRHTVLPYYLPLASAKAHAEVWVALTSEECESTRYPLGQLTGRYGAHHPVKACPACMADDKARFGIAYWHRLHQLPSVWLCPKHRSVLRECVRKQEAGTWASLCMPDSCRWRSTAPREQMPLADLELWASVVENSASYIEDAPHLSLDRCRVCAVLAAQAMQLGATDEWGKLDFFKCAQILMQACGASSCLPELSTFCQDERHAVSMARQVFGSEFRSSVQGLLIAVSCLHGSWTAFLKAYQDEVSSSMPAMGRMHASRPVRTFF
ncbi:TniQ family protein [Ralstonia sp. 1138]|uniref:TniQ family protein n=1 Tax=Ralstonia sp. 1138 TaxID=3156423 RepID=UPI003398BC94